MERTSILCACGCGTELLSIDKKGRPRRFIRGHSTRGEFKELNRNWKGITVSASGHRYKMMPEHSHSNAAGYVAEATLVVESVLGFLPKIVLIHHVDGNPANNTVGNLVLCQDDAYHVLLHRRTRALKACGHASWQKCNYCGRYDDPANMVRPGNPKDDRMFHKSCPYR